MSIRILFSADARKAKRYLDVLKKNMADELALVMRAAADEMAQKAKDLAPEDDGILRDSIYVEADQEDKPYGFYVFAGGNKAKYAPYQEFGTRFATPGPPGSIPEELKDQAIKFKADPLLKATNVPARPFMYPGLLHGRKKLAELLEAAMLKYKKENGLTK